MGWKRSRGQGGLARHFSCPPSFLSAVFLAEWRTGGPARRLPGGPDPIYISFLFHQTNQQRIHYCYLNGESADFSETIAIGLYRLP